VRRAAAAKKILCLIMALLMFFACAEPILTHRADAAEPSKDKMEEIIKQQVADKRSELESAARTDDTDGDGTVDGPGVITEAEQEAIDKECQEYEKMWREVYSDPGYTPSGRSDDENSEEFRDAAEDAYDGSWLETLIDAAGSGAPGYFTDLIGGEIDNLSGLPISDFFSGDWITLVEEIIVDKVLEQITVLDDIADVVGVVVKTALHRAQSHTDAFHVEILPIVAGGAVLIVGGVVIAALSKGLESKAYWVEAVTLAGIDVLEIAADVTLAAIYAEQIIWDNAIQGDYGDDHKALPGGAAVYGDLTARHNAARETMNMGTSASFAASGGAGAKFDAISPGYRASPSGLYIDDYKKMTGDWKKYADAQKSVAASEAAGLSELKGTVDKLAAANLAAPNNRSRLSSNGDFMGYRQAIESRAQVNAFTAQQVSHLRNDIPRQIDGRARAALDRQQRRADLHAAFGRAVGGGVTWAAGTSY
jgi:hypothetical protein